MNIRQKLTLLAAVAISATGSLSSGQGWTEVNLTGAPYIAGQTILLTDGSVLIQYPETPDWYRMYPDAFGKYENARWAKAASLPSNYSPVATTHAVLADGRVILFGGLTDPSVVPPTESNLCFIYDPVKDTWTPLASPPGWSTIGQAHCCVLKTGQVILSRPLDAKIAILDPATLSWSDGSSLGRIESGYHESFTLMRDGSLLVADVMNAPLTESYLPDQKRWVSSNSALPMLIEPKVYFMTNLVLMPSGNVIATGGVGHIEKYTPSIFYGSPGTWSFLSDLPKDIMGNQLKHNDGCAALLPNGHVLFEIGKSITDIDQRFYETDESGNFQYVGPSATGGGQSAINMVLLPTGQALVTAQKGDTFLHLKGKIGLYACTGTFQDAWRPRITNCPTTLVAGKSFSLVGQQLNGMSQGTFKGTSGPNATNFPLVRVTYKNGAKHVAFFRTFSHSSMGVQTGTLPVTTHIDVPANAELGPATLEVVTNGIPSLPVNVNIQNGPLTPASMTMYEGSSAIGTVASVSGSDNTYYQVRSASVTGVGHVASAVAGFTLPSSGGTQFQFTVECNVSSPVQSLYYMYNYRTGRYDSVASASLSSVDKVVAFQVLNAADYAGPNGAVKLLVRAISPLRARGLPLPIVLSIDQVTMTPG